MTKRSPSLFAQWIEAMGLNKKQVTVGGELLGLSTPAAVRRNRGAQESDLMERLAMSALRAGLPPWSPKVDAEISASKTAMDLLRALAENQVRPSSKTK